MRRDVINGYEWLIFEESERDEAYAKVAEGHSRVRIATTCVECHEYIEAAVGDRRPRHSESYHQSTTQ